MRKKFGLPLGIFVIGCGVLATLVLAKPKPTPNLDEAVSALIKVAVETAKPQPVRLTVDAQGTVEPKREINLMAEVSGLVVSVDSQFDDGGFFNKDHVLVKIDDRDYYTALLSAKARLADAERRVAQERGLARQAQREWRDLGNTNANDLFIRKPQLASAVASLAFAKADVESAQLNVQRANMSVPFNGRIKQTSVNVGQFVNKGSTVATVYDAAIAEIRLPLTEAQAALIDLPFTADAQTKPSVLIKGVVAGQSHTWKGLLTRTEAFVDTRTRMYYAVVEVANPFAGELPLLPGLFVDAYIEGKALDNVLVLPRAALFQRNKMLILDSDHKTRALTVHVLRKTAGQVWLQSKDVVAGTPIVIEKQTLTPEGTEVEAVFENIQKADAVISAASSQ